MKTNITNLSLFQIVQLLPILAFIAMASMPQYTLAFSQNSALGAPFSISENRIILQNSASSSQTLPIGVTITVTLTAYSSTPEQTDADPFTTASGTYVRPGVAAANFLPFGTRVQLGNTVYTIEDRTGSGDWHHIDLWMSSTEKARVFGVQTAQMNVVSAP